MGRWGGIAPTRRRTECRTVARRYFDAAAVAFFSSASSAFRGSERGGKVETKRERRGGGERSEPRRAGNLDE